MGQAEGVAELVDERHVVVGADRDRSADVAFLIDRDEALIVVVRIAVVAAGEVGPAERALAVGVVHLGPDEIGIGLAAHAGEGDVGDGRHRGHGVLHRGDFGAGDGPERGDGAAGEVDAFVAALPGYIITDLGGPDGCPLAAGQEAGHPSIGGGGGGGRGRCTSHDSTFYATQHEGRRSGAKVRHLNRGIRCKSALKTCGGAG